MIDYHHNKETNTIYVTFSGDFQLEDIKDYISTMSKFESDKGMLVLENMEHAVLKFDFKEIEKDFIHLMSLIKNMAAQFHSVKVASIVGSSSNRAILQYFANASLSTNGYYHKVFNSQNEALDWLHSRK